MASVSWTYPADELVALEKAAAAAEAAALVADNIQLTSLNSPTGFRATVQLGGKSSSNSGRMSRRPKCRRCS